jgi:hypothetical protein
MTDTLSQLRICVQKPLPHEEKELKKLQNTSNSGYHFEKLRAAFFVKKLWKNNSTIKISFNPSSNKKKSVHWTPLAVLESQRNNDGSPVKLDPIEYEIRKLSPEEAVKKIVKERIEPIVNLNFEFVENNGNVRISFDPEKGAYSLLGTDCLHSKEETTMNLGWLDAATIMHEFGHVLGLIHEHQNPSGTESIDWNKEEVYKWANETQGWDHDTTYHNILQKYDHNQLNASNFDPKSIMLYFFAPELTNNHKGTNNNKRLSKEDVEYISKIYPGGKMSPSEFYKEAYGESISSSLFSMKNFLILLGILILILVVFMVVRFFIKKRKTSGRRDYENYSQWAK